MDLKTRLQHPLVVAVATNLLVLLGILSLSLIPAWSIRPIGGSSTLDYYYPKAWSPDGSMFVKEGGGRFEVAAADGRIVVHDQAGLAPVWIDDDTLLVVRHVDQKVGWLVRIDTRDGGREMVGKPVPLGRLVADGRGHVAIRTVVGQVATAILDPADGSVLARLEGYRAEIWTNDGGLILGQRPPNLGLLYPDAGTMSIWRPGQPLRSLATGLILLDHAPLLAPAGDAVACYCMATPVAAGDAGAAFYRVPLDSSQPTLMTSWETGNPHGFPGVAWIDDQRIAVMDRYGVARVEDGNRQPVINVEPPNLTLAFGFGRVYHFDGAVVVVTKDPRRSTRDAYLTVIDDDGRMRLQRRFDAWNMPSLLIDPKRHRAVVVTDPNDPGENPLRLFMLDFN
jgi:hypothetical protein